MRERGAAETVLIVIGVLIGTLLGVPSARQVKMTAIPRMVASASAVVVLSRS